VIYNKRSAIKTWRRIGKTPVWAVFDCSGEGRGIRQGDWRRENGKRKDQYFSLLRYGFLCR